MFLHPQNNNENDDDDIDDLDWDVDEFKRKKDSDEKGDVTEKKNSMFKDDLKLPVSVGEGWQRFG